MKTAALFLLLVLNASGLFSQDTLYTKAGRVINAKVTEINPSEIKYKKASNPEGPVYIINKSEVVLIHFRNGSKEVFAEQDSEGDEAVAQAGSSGQGQSQTIVNNYGTNGNAFYPGVVFASPGINLMLGGAFPYLAFSGWGWRGGYRWPYRGSFVYRGYNHGYYGGHRGGYHGHFHHR